ncbi:hypothetical protein E3E12_08185 [Formicincola oecophyllae]|uniref:Uncharacterized protein n=1 Tax=Formicincola oecophyllae TaxID=2558361 RepID=A0A4Y6UAE4_9PROT|nr:hypothetical protein [Formicincola oecophyllae]QDH14174.1 hypothetical protein E3E12_08185 [Formicincola oecophyllae]
MADYHVTLNSTSTLSNGSAGPSWTTSFTLPGVATVSELASYATVDDLKDYATLSQLSGCATKSDLKTYATTAQLGGYLARAGGQVVGDINMAHPSATAPLSSSPFLTLNLPAADTDFTLYNYLDGNGVGSGVVQVHSPSQPKGTNPWTWMFSGLYGCLLNSSANAMVAAPGNQRRLSQPFTVSAKDGDWIAFPVAFAGAYDQQVLATATDLSNAPVTACRKAGHARDPKGFVIGLYAKDGSPIATPITVDILAYGPEA